MAGRTHLALRSAALPAISPRAAHPAERDAMNWITNYVKPRLGFLRQDNKTSENLWLKDPASGELIFRSDLEANQYVVPGSDHHMKIPPTERLKHFLDRGEFTEVETPDVVQDPLKFRSRERYSDKLRENRQKTGRRDAVLVATGELLGLGVVCTVQDFAFMGGSLGMAAGEAILKGFEEAVRLNRPLILFAASGGARMQEGVLSLMQLPRTTVGVEMMREANLPYFVVLTNPTTGGVTASYAMLGDVQIAEPGALIGFAGARVIEQTIREKLPEGFQSAEYLREHGMVDMVVDRRDLRGVVGRMLRMMLGLDTMDAREERDRRVEDSGPPSLNGVTIERRSGDRRAPDGAQPDRAEA